MNDERPRPQPRAIAAAAAALALTFSTRSDAQSAPAEGAPLKGAYHTWTSATFQGPIHENIVFFGDVHARFFDDMHPFNVIVRPSIGYKLPLGFAAHAGYAFTPIWNDKRELAEEHRAWEQLSYEAPLSSVKLSTRARFEQRFRPDSDVQHRLRIQARANIPLGLPVPLQSVIWDELFLGLSQGEAWQPEVLDQNRLFVGLAWLFSKGVRAEVGYLGQVSPRKTALNVNHALSLNAFVSW